MTVAELFSDGQISIEVIGIKGNQVRLGIHAPKSLKILRDDANELDESITLLKLKPDPTLLDFIMRSNY
ncbi:MAG: carbon storage regulator CsrA [Oleiphilaceae bacterium]|jgi:carbon storage regulator CsrA